MRFVCAFALAALAAGTSVPAAAQSLLYRPPNMSGTWAPPGGVLQFNFMHRFTVASSAGSNKVTNFPTFTFALGLGHGVSVGTHYSSNSLLVLTPYRPNEFELFAAWRRGAADGDQGLAVAVMPAYNAAARSLDGEVAAQYTAGPVTLSGAVRAVSKPFGAGDAHAALSGGVNFRINDYIALAGDAASYLGIDTAAAWSAGLAFVIPGSPHTFSFHASKASSNTIQGASYGFSRVIYGFEFTIPIHFSRFAPWFSHRAPPAAQVAMREHAYAADSVVVTAGQAVRWTNRDNTAHTVTFADQGVHSSGTIAANGTFAVSFARPGVYHYHCAPHPEMRGVVVVR